MRLSLLLFCFSGLLLCQQEYRLVPGLAHAGSERGRHARRLESDPGSRRGYRLQGPHSGAASRRAPDPGIRKRREVCPLLGRRDVQRRKGDGGRSRRSRSRSLRLFGRLWAGRMRFLRRALGAGRSGGEHLGGRRPRSSDLQNEPPREGDPPTGPKGESPGLGPDNFNPPTDAAFAANGDFYVSDGYGNARVREVHAPGEISVAVGRSGGTDRTVSATA